MNIVEKALAARADKCATDELIEQQNAAQIRAFREALRLVLGIETEIDLVGFKSSFGAIFRLETVIDGLHVYSVVCDGFIVPHCVEVSCCANGAKRRVFNLVTLGDVLRTDAAFERLRGANGS